MQSKLRQYPTSTHNKFLIKLGKGKLPQFNKRLSEPLTTPKLMSKFVEYKVDIQK